MSPQEVFTGMKSSLSRMVIPFSCIFGWEQIGRVVPAYTDHLNIPKFTGNGFVNGLSFYRPQMECQNPWQLGMVFDIIPFDRM